MIISAGQNRVKDDWIKLTPTKAARINHHGDTSQASRSEVSTRVPASNRIESSSVIRLYLRITILQA